MPETTVNSPSDGANLVDVRNLVVEFKNAEGTVRAVDDVTFSIRPQKTLGVVGESGCGKSVTAKAIMRIEDPQCRRLKGQILLKREDGVRDLVPLDRNNKVLRAVRGREIGLIFQEPMTSFSPVHTIGNQIVETIRLHFTMGRQDARDLAIKQMREVGMPHPEHILSQYSWELSGGLRQRAMIAMALVCGPSVLIADEPTTALDVTTQAQVLELMRELQKQKGAAVMLITHDLGVVAEMSDEVLVMYLGAIVERGPVDAIFYDPKHPYTRLLLKSMPSVTQKREARLETIAGAVPHPLHRPKGCAFHSRCPDAITGVCDQNRPKEIAVGANHFASCHLYGERDESVGAAPVTASEGA